MALPQFDITLSVLADAAATLDFDEGRGLDRELVLATHGLLIQGRLIGPGAYFQGVAQGLAQGATPPINADADLFRLFEDMTRLGQEQHVEARGRAATGEAAPLTQAETEEAYAAFIHLQHVTILTGGAEIRLPLWRARLTEITGWTFGTLGTR